MRWPSTACAAWLAALASCGGGDDRPTRTARVSAGETVRVTAREYSFDPGRIVATGGGPLRFVLANEGDLAHNLKVFAGERELGGTESFPAGQERTFRVAVPPGSYALVCTVADHRELGMEGELQVGPRR